MAFMVARMEPPPSSPSPRRQVTRMLNAEKARTTGTDPATDAIIEIALVDRAHDRQPALESSCGRPIPVPPESSAVHHLIDEDLAFAPRLEDVLSSGAAVGRAALPTIYRSGRKKVRISRASSSGCSSAAK